MCVHLVKKIDSMPVISVYEDQARNSMQVYFSEKPSVHQPGRKSFTKTLRRKEINRLTGKSFKGSFVEEHRLSPQHSLTVLKRTSTDWYEDSGKRKCGPRGLNDRYKNRPLSGSGKTRAVATFW